MIEFKVEGRPVPQPRPRVYRTATGKSKAVNSRQSINYKRIVKYAALSEMNKQRLTMTDRPLAMRLTFVFAPPKSYTKKKIEAVKSGELRYTKKPDLDNLAKAILDACNNTVYKDDSQIITLSINKEYGHTDHVLINITEV